MYYTDRAELDIIGRAGLSYFMSEHGNPVVRLNSNFWLECEKDDTAFTEPAMRTGNWEAWNAVAIMREIETAPSFFFDIGANVGYYTLMAAMGNTATFSYEPHPDTYKLLQRSITLNKAWGMVSTMNCGLSDEAGFLNLYEVDHHSGANTFIKSQDEDRPHKTVQITTLDDDWEFADFIPGARLVLKVDVEGFERKVWDGAKNIREKTDNIWFLEWVPERSPEAENRDFLEDVLKTHDLQIVNHDGSLRSVGVGDALAVEFETIVFRKRLD